MSNVSKSSGHVASDCLFCSPSAAKTVPVVGLAAPVGAGQVGDTPIPCLFPQPQFVSDLHFRGTGSYCEQTANLRADPLLLDMLYRFGECGLDRSDLVATGGSRSFQLDGAIYELWGVWL